MLVAACDSSSPGPPDGPDAAVNRLDASRLDAMPDMVISELHGSVQHLTGTPVELRPDWTCEVISESNATNDTINELRLYHRVGIPHYWWLADPRDATSTVLRWSEPG